MKIYSIFIFFICVSHIAFANHIPFDEHDLTNFLYNKIKSGELPDNEVNQERMKNNDLLVSNLKEALDEQEQSADELYNQDEN